MGPCGGAGLGVVSKVGIGGEVLCRLAGAGGDVGVMGGWCGVGRKVDG